MATIHEIAKASSPSGTFVTYIGKRYQVAKINYIIDRIDLIDAKDELIENVSPADLTLATEIADVFVEVQIGTLTIPYGARGYAMAQVGHPVFLDERGHYAIYLDSEKEGASKNKIRFYTETLSPYIKFANK